MKIYKFNPIYKSTLWGGDRIAPFKGEDSLAPNVGESWEISAVKGNESVVSDGDEAGLTLPQLIEKHRGALVGDEVYSRFGTEFPLLIKFIDAALDLSIQVHPDDSLARERHGSLGKTEMWYVVDAAPGATLLSGLKEKISKEEYVKSVADNTIADKLCRYDVNAGDCFFLPAGRIHSIGAGSFVAEIQETSDVTYRIYDFNRRDSEGNLRQLHTELAVDAIDYSVSDDYRTRYTLKKNNPTELVKCPYFTTSLFVLTEGKRLDLKGIASFVILMVCDGGVAVEVDGEQRRCRRGETLLLPATAEALFLAPTGASARVLLCHI